jgi:glycosyltransferase involved in cell wall biosynthesis
VRRWLYIPDGQVGWYPFALRAARRTMLETRFDAIFSSSFPITSHLVASRLQRTLGVPWVAEFRDPWTDAALYDSQIRRRLDRRIEASILRHADAVVTVSRHWADLFRSRGARQVSVITNGFDAADYPATVAAEDVVSYMGTYYPHMQDLRTALLALGSLRRRGALPGYRLRFIGTLPESLQGTLLKSGLAEVVECTGFVGHYESLRHLMASRILLLAGPSSAAGISKGVIPGKTFEYIGAHRPILCVGHPEAELTAMLRKVPGVEIVAPGDTAGAERALQALLNTPMPTATGDDELFTRRALTGQLARVLDRAAGSTVS